MRYVVFELTGDMALWRNPYESMGSFSCLGPAPSNLAGLCGAALGFASPRSQGAAAQDEKKLTALSRDGLPWPVSAELLRWEEANDYHVACRWTGGFPRRVPWNVKGLKEIGNNDILRLQQQVIDRPAYEVAVRLAGEAGGQLVAALGAPAFPLCLGASFCRAIVRDARVQDELPPGGNWAQRKAVALGEGTPLSLHVVNAGEGMMERIRSDGYWQYPTPAFAGELQADPLVKGYCRMEPEKR